MLHDSVRFARMDQSFRLRAPTEEDVDRLFELDRGLHAELGIAHAGTPDDILQQWRHPMFDPSRHATIVEVGNRLVAAGKVYLEGVQVHAGGYVDPAFRGRGIGRALQERMIDIARTEPGVTEYHTWCAEQIPSGIELIGSLPGSEYLRTFVRMRNGAPADTAEPSWPDGINLVHLEGDALIEAYIRGYDNSFIDHWNFQQARRADVAHELELPDTDPRLWFIAAGPEGVIAGFNLCSIKRSDDVVRGYLGPIGTTRPFRGIGLGRALLRHGLREMADRGATEVVLGVDAQNPNGALGLYERNGFAVIGRGRVYRVKI